MMSSFWFSKKMGRGLRTVLFWLRYCDELQDAALVLELVGLARPLVEDGDLEALVQERQLPHPLGQDVEAELGRLEDLVVGPEGDLGPGLLGLADELELRQGGAALVALGVDAAVALDLEVEALGQGVDDGDADAVETAGDLVGLVVELAAGVEDGHDDLGGRLLLLLVHLDRDAAAVVDDRHGVVDVDEDVDLGAESGQGLVDAVVDDLVDEVMEPVRARCSRCTWRAACGRLPVL